MSKNDPPANPTYPMLDTANTRLSSMVTDPRANTNLPAGAHGLRQNLRYDEKQLYCRQGISTGVSVPSGCTGLVDLYSCQLNGTAYLFGAFYDGATYRVYSMVAPFTTWQEITCPVSGGSTSYGYSGATRMTGPWVANQGFCAIKTRMPVAYGSNVGATRDVLVIQSGSDLPRIYDPGLTNTAFSNAQSKMFIHNPVSQNGSENQFGYNPTFSNFATIRASSAKTYPSGGVVNQTRYNCSDTAVATITGATNATPIVIGTSAGPSTVGPLINGQKMYIRGVGGNLAANGTFYIKAVSPATWSLSYGGATSFALYSDAALTQPVVGTGNYTSGGVFGVYDSNSGNLTTKLIRGTTCAIGDYAVMPVSISGTNSGVFFAVESPQPTDWQNILANCTIEIGTGGSYAGASWTLIYDPANADVSLNSYVVPSSQPGNNIYYFWFNTTAVSAGTFIRFKEITGAPASDQWMTILNVCFTGAWLGGTQFAVSYVDTFGLAEGPGWQGTLSLGDTTAKVGGPMRNSFGDPPTIGNFGNLKYDYRIRFGNPTTAGNVTGGLSGSPSSVYVYAKPNGSNKFYYLKNLDFYVAGLVGGVPGWAYQTSLGTGSFCSYTLKSSDGNQSNLLYQTIMPSPYNLTIPSAKTMRFANNRLFVGNMATPYSPSTVLASCVDPTRMQEVPIDETGAFDGTLGSRIEFGPEKVQRIFSTNAGTQNDVYIFALTNAGLYQLGSPAGEITSDATRGYAGSVGVYQRPKLKYQNGTQSPRSVIEDRGRVWWIDHNGKIVEFSSVNMWGGETSSFSQSGIKDISYFAVADRIRNLPAGRIANVAAGFFNDRYFLGYTPTSQTSNKKALVYNTRTLDDTGMWESEDVPANACTYDFFASVYDANIAGNGMRFFVGSASTGVLYELENASQTTDGGTGPTINLTSGEVLFNGIASFGEVTIESDAQTGQSASIVRSYYPSGSTDSASTLSLVDPDNSGYSRITNKDTLPGSTWGGLDGSSGVISVSAQVTAGWQCRRVIVQILPSSTTYGKR